jgi:hypothetical protein
MTSSQTHRQPLANLVSSLLLALLFAPALLSGCSRESDLKFDTPYQAIFMDTGQVFFGRLEESGSPYPVLRDVFYLQRVMDPQKKEARNILVKRGSEWHSPDFMRLNARHIVVIEPVANNSRVAQLIKEAKAGGPATSIPEASNPGAATPEPPKTEAPKPPSHKPPGAKPKSDR